MTYDRSAVMRAVKSRDTEPELAVRVLLRPIAPGYRLQPRRSAGKAGYRLHVPQARDFRARLLLARAQLHARRTQPKANADYWRAKIARNCDRDVKTLAAYAAMGWRTLVVHECELKDKASLSARFAEALRNAGSGVGKAQIAAISAYLSALHQNLPQCSILETFANGCARWPWPPKSKS